MTKDEFFRQLCASENWTATDATLAVMTEWSRLEGVDTPKGLAFSRGFNPWCTTRLDPDIALSKENLGFGAGNWNGVPVRMYATPADGLKATQRTLDNGFYARIREMFSRASYVDGVEAEFTTWIGSPGYAADMATFAREQFSRTAPPPVQVFDPIEDLLLALFAGSEQPGDRATRLAYARGRVAEIAAGTKPSVLEVAGSALALAASKDSSGLVTIIEDFARVADGVGPSIRAIARARG